MLLKFLFCLISSQSHLLIPLLHYDPLCICSVGRQGPESQVEPVHTGGGVWPDRGAVLLLAGRERPDFLKSHLQTHTTKPSPSLLSPHPFMVCERTVALRMRESLSSTYIGHILSSLTRYYQETSRLLLCCWGKQSDSCSHPEIKNINRRSEHVTHEKCLV